MTARSKSSGHDIIYKDGKWINEKTGEIDIEVQPCNYCGKKPIGVKLCKPRKSGRSIVPVDCCIAQKVQTFNDAGFVTVSSCCGHGKDYGKILMQDGREILLEKKKRKVGELDL